MASGDYSKVIDEARSLLAQGDAVDENSMGFKKLCAGLMRDEIKGIGYHRDRLSGGEAFNQFLESSESEKSATHVGPLDPFSYLYPKNTSSQFKSPKISIRTESPPISHANVSTFGLLFLRPHINSAYNPEK